MAALTVTSPEFAWSLSRGKRLFDLLAATLLAALSLPLLLLSALAVKLASPGPVLFRQQRVGKDGKTFDLLKVRSMTYNREQAGPGVTRQGDSRIFPAGAVLRRYKLDELPQFLNVIRGDMSLVGPRPDLAEYYAQLNDEHREILRVRPGMTGAATLQFRNEEALLAQVPAADLRHYYVKFLLPEKVEIDLNYARRATLLGDVKIILRTAGAMLG